MVFNSNEGLGWDNYIPGGAFLPREPQDYILIATSLLNSSFHLLDERSNVELFRILDTGASIIQKAHKSMEEGAFLAGYIIDFEQLMLLYGLMYGLLSLTPRSLYLRELQFPALKAIVASC